MSRSESVAESVAAAQLQCVARTKKGAPCRSFVPAGRTLCLAHDPDRQSAVREARAKGGAKASKIRAIRGRRSKLATAGELLKFTAGVIQEAREGAIAPDVARAVLYGISIQRQLIEASDLEQRLAELEDRVTSVHSNPTERGTRWPA